MGTTEQHEQHKYTIHYSKQTTSTTTTTTTNNNDNDNTNTNNNVKQTFVQLRVQNGSERLGRIQTHRMS